VEDKTNLSERNDIILWTWKIGKQDTGGAQHNHYYTKIQWKILEKMDLTLNVVSQRKRGTSFKSVEKKSSYFTTNLTIVL